MAYPEGLLTSSERVHEHLRPHTRMLVVPAVLPPLTVGVAMGLAGLVSRASWHPTAWIVLAVVTTLVVGRFSLVPLLRWWCTHLVVTDRRLLVREGVLSRSGIAVAGASIAGVRTLQRGTDRLFGCGTLLVSTHDADDPWELHGIPHVVRTAALVEEVAEERGGLRDPEDDDLDDDDLNEDDDRDEPEDDEILEGELEEDEPDDEFSRSRRFRRGAGRTSR